VTLRKLLRNTKNYSVISFGLIQDKINTWKLSVTA
jgi:hypothetical protein